MSYCLRDFSQIPRRALALYYRALENGWHCRIKALLTRRSLLLRALDEVISRSELQHSAYAGVQSVNLDLIQGTHIATGRQNDFDIHFHPLKI